jgi:molybdopterin-containing oxidoreductase family iron-sulfur binding subunit
MKRLPIVYDKDRSGRTYWRSIGEQQGSPEVIDSLAREFPDGASEMSPEEAEVSRRGFLGVMGAALAMGMAACRRPVEHIVPYSRAPEELIPGKPLYYATTIPLYGTAIGLLVESHEGRPTKIEGNPRHPESLGATTTFVQASVLDLYDPDRSTSPVEKGQKRSWDDATTALRALGARLKGQAGKGLAVLTEAHRSPTLQAALGALKTALPEARIVRWSPFDRTAAREGLKLAFGRALDVVHAIDQAKVVVTLDADPFYAEGSPIKTARQWAQGRRPEGPMNRLYSVESTYTVTGGNADHRLRLTSRDVANFAVALAQKLGVQGIAPAAPLSPKAQKFLDALAKDLDGTHGASAIIAGDGLPPAIHAVVALINDRLGNVGKSVRYVRPFDEAPEGPKAIVELAKAIETKQVDTVLVLGGNPAFDAPADANFAKILATAATSVHLSTHVDETSQACSWHLNRTHFLETWGDLRAEDGTASIVQPLIAPLYDGRTDAEVVSLILGDGKRAYELVRETFAKFGGDESAWKRALHDGVVPNTASAAEQVDARPADVAGAIAALPPAGAFEVTFRLDDHAYDGRFANNGWMQELPSPLSKLTWGSGAHLSPATAKELGVGEGDVLSITVEGASVSLPVVILPGQADKSIAVNLGQGRRVGRVAQGVGVDVYPIFKSTFAGRMAAATVNKAAAPDPILARTQEHFLMEGRPLVREATVTQYAHNPMMIKEMVEGPPLESLWYGHPYEGHKWGLVVDTNACIGCNACMVACQAENNVPVVGKKGVVKSREMHWLRIDRYFVGDLEEPKSVTQPMLCQQCENAPCEQVCPVGATSHSPEGLNDMAYNRCIGTRYCANNCPYKVRRFNFFNYSKNFTKTAQMQLNPDVTVRSRGVMEKCTWCVQRINNAKIDAKKANPDGRVKDGAIVTACQQACPTAAITFGDYNDRESAVSRRAGEARAYALLSEFNFRPRLQYLAKIRNPNNELEAEPVAAAGHHASGKGDGTGHTAGESSAPHNTPHAPNAPAGDHQNGPAHPPHAGEHP